MLRNLAVLLAAGLLIGHGAPAAGADSTAAAAFPEVPLPAPPRVSHTAAHATIAGGLALVGLSFALSDRANDRYDEYLRSTDPARIDELYRETVSLDRWSTATLLGGEALVMTGLYLRFLRRAPQDRLTLHATPGGCAVSFRF